MRKSENLLRLHNTSDQIVANNCGCCWSWDSLLQSSVGLCEVVCHYIYRSTRFGQFRHIWNSSQFYTFSLLFISRYAGDKSLSRYSPATLRYDHEDAGLMLFSCHRDTCNHRKAATTFSTFSMHVKNFIHLMPTSST